MLFLTPLTPSALVTGKFFGAIGETCMLLCAGVPVMGTVLAVYGGVSCIELISGYLVLLCSGALFAACGLFASCQFRRSYFTLPLGYLAMLLLLPATTVGLCLPVLVGEFGTLALAVMHVMITVTLTIGLLRLCAHRLRRLQQDLTLPGREPHAGDHAAAAERGK